MTRISLNDKLADEAAAIFESMGMDLATGINVFLNKVTQVRAIPFAMEAPEAPAAAMQRAHKQAKAVHKSLDAASDPLAALTAKMNARKVGADVNRPPAASLKIKAARSQGKSTKREREAA